MQVSFSIIAHVIGCGHVSGLLMRRSDLSLAVMEIRGDLAPSDALDLT